MGINGRANRGLGRKNTEPTKRKVRMQLRRSSWLTVVLEDEEINEDEETAEDEEPRASSPKPLSIRRKDRRK